MTSGSDDLEQELRRNLKLRRELGAEAAKGKAALNAKQRGGVAYRLGWVLYWICLALMAAWLCALIWDTIDPYRFASFWRTLGYRGQGAEALVRFTPFILLYGIGRAFRYVLSGR